MNLVDHLNNLWNGLLDFAGRLVSPDWGALIGLLPLFVLVGVVGPLLSLIALRWIWYFLIKPRTRHETIEGTPAAPLNAVGRPPGGAAAA